MLGRDRAQQARQGVAVRDVTSLHGHRGALCRQFGDEFRGSLGGEPAPAGEHQVPYAALGHQMAGQHTAQTARTTGDQDRALGIPYGRHGQHDLADMPGHAHEAERVARPAYVPRPHRQRLQHAAFEQFHDGDQHPLDAVRFHPTQVECLVVHAVRQFVGLPDVGLAHLQEPAAGTGQPQRRVHELTGQRVQHDIDTPAARDPGERRLEVRRTRRGEVILGHTQRPQDIPLALARRREHLGTQMPRHLDRRHTHTTRTGMDQHLLAAPQTAQLHQRVVRGQEHEWHRRRRLPRPAVGQPGEEPRVADHQRAEAAGHQAGDRVAGPQPGHLGTHFGHHARGLAPHASGVARVHVEGLEDIAEVDPGGPYVDTYAAAGQRFEDLGERGQGQPVEASLGRAVEPPGHPGRRYKTGARRQPCEPARQDRAVADRHLGLVRGQGPGERRGAVVRAAEVHQAEAAGVLRLRGAHQSPYRGRRDIAGLLVTGRHGAPGDEHQPRAGEPFLGQPVLRERQYARGQRVGGLRHPARVPAPVRARVPVPVPGHGDEHDVRHRGLPRRQRRQIRVGLDARPGVRQSVGEPERVGPHQRDGLGHIRTGRRRHRHPVEAEQRVPGQRRVLAQLLARHGAYEQ
ncbi:hypothetical protein CU044_1309 [Streptomyces sp. L-9-10]|nr:hypothetical protein CU044_1309 [Streptomyces sp. L-9-10]